MVKYKKRSKTWEEKVSLAKDCFSRAKLNNRFAEVFYENLFFLSPKVEELFAGTDPIHQNKALMHGLDFLFEYLDEDEGARAQIKRLAKVHNINGLNIHPHLYYYWSEALLLTVKEFDYDWFDDLEYYVRETTSYPLSFMISQYFITN